MLFVLDNLLFIMGGNISGSTEFNYRTKTGIPISYIFYDLKGKNRFMGEPSNETEVNKMFEECIRQIEVSASQHEILKEFNKKYKYRFVLMTKRKIAEYDEKLSLTSSYASMNNEQENENPSEKKRHMLEEKIKEIEQNKSSLKIVLMKLDKFISEKKAQFQFIELDGITRILTLLDKQIKSNKDGLKTNFSNQIDLLRFLKSYSSHFPKEFYTNIDQCENYGAILIKAYHPVNVGVTCYVLSLLEDYIWRCQSNQNIFLILKQFAKQENYDDFLFPFAETLRNTDNILMVYYNLKFINELLGATVDEKERQSLRDGMQNVKYGIVIENIKARLQEGFYRLEACTFAYVHQQIFKYATKGQKDYNKDLSNPQVNINIRNTVNIRDLQEHIMMNLMDLEKENQEEKQSDEEEEEEFMTIYLNETSKGQFEKCILDVVYQIGNYLKLEIYSDPEFADKNFNDEEKKHMILENRMDDLKMGDFMKHIRNNCIKNDCSDLMFACMKNLQYFEKNHWKKLDSYILEELGINKKPTGDEIENIKRVLKDKEELIRKLMRENTDQKVQIAQLKEKAKLNPSSSTSLQNMPATTLKTNFSQPPTLQQKSSVLPPPPSLTGSNLPPPPSLNGTNNLPPPPTLNSTNLPPPPSLNGTNLPPPPSLNGSSLPPPPSLNGSSLPPPPSLNGSSLPPPPSLNGSSLPPPPSLNGTNLPPPPSLNGSSLPPPPSLNGSILPPPPSLNGSTLPPPPTMKTNLPPPPSLGGSSLPPPPSLGGGLPPPPSLGGGLPPPPSIGGGLPPPPSIGGGLQPPSIGGLSLPNQGSSAKMKQKKKPNVPMKGCNIAVLNYEKIQDTVWEKVDDEKVKLDYSEIQSLFSKKTEDKKPDTITKSLALPSEKKKEVVKLIGAERWRNIQIVLTKLKIPKGQMKKALIECSGKYVAPLTLQSINKILPTDEEQDMIKMYNGEDELGKPEQFYKELMEVPQFSHRIKSIIFVAHKAEHFYEIEQKLDQLNQAFESLIDNKRFQHALEVSLAVSNYLNGTSFKGGAWGLKLDSIERMEEVKSQDNKMNAAFYVIKEVWKKYAYPLFNKEELQLYQQPSKVPVSQINIELGELRRYLINLRKAMNSKIQNNEEDIIAEYCEETKLELQLKLQKFTQRFKKLQTKYHECAKFYCEDPKKTSSDEVGKKIFKCILFISNTQKTLKMLEDRWKKEADRKAIKNEMKFSSNEESRKSKMEKENKEKEEEGEKKEKQVQNTLKMPNNLPKPPEFKKEQKSKEERMKEFEKNQKKAMDEMMKKRETKLTAFRKSKAPELLKGTFEQIGFLKGVK